MTRHLSEIRLNDYVEDLLDPAERRVAARHLALCVACRHEAETLLSLRAELAALPEGIPPSRDLYPGIVARTWQSRPASAGRARVGSRRRGVWSLRYPLAAAALVLVLLSAAAAALMLRTETTDAG